MSCCRRRQGHSRSHAVAKSPQTSQNLPLIVSLRYQGSMRCSRPRSAPLPRGRRRPAPADGGVYPAYPTARCRPTTSGAVRHDVPTQHPARHDRDTTSSVRAGPRRTLDHASSSTGLQQGRVVQLRLQPFVESTTLPYGGLADGFYEVGNDPFRAIACRAANSSQTLSRSSAPPYDPITETPFQRQRSLCAGRNGSARRPPSAITTAAPARFFHPNDHRHRRID